MTAALLDPVCAARVLGWCSARKNDAPLRKMLDAAPPPEVSRFLQRLAAGDPVLREAQWSGYYAATGALDDLAVARKSG